jgi:hypothetical protein
MTLTYGIAVAARGSVVAAAILLAGVPAQALTTIPVFSTNFESSQVLQSAGPFPATVAYSAGGATITGAQSLPGFGRRFLRNSTNGTTQFAFTNLDPHESLTLSFDLAFLDSWDRVTDRRWGPDYLFVQIGDTQYQWGLDYNGQQTWPGQQVGRGAYGFNGQWQDSVHRFTFTVPDQGQDFIFSIRGGGAGYQGGNDESWGIDNISLTAAVPEPASWALLIAGFGLVGSALRRRRFGGASRTVAC